MTIVTKETRLYSASMAETAPSTCVITAFFLSGQLSCVPYRQSSPRAFPIREALCRLASHPLWALLST